VTKLGHAYHMAEATNWPAIQRDGLCSASALMDRALIVGPERDELERRQRCTSVTLNSGARLRDQRPMPPEALSRCLVGMVPAEWYATVNARVFFWLDPARLNRQRAACNDRPQVVLTVDASALVAAYGDRVRVTPINTGNARRQPARRGVATFVPYATWATTGWASEAAALGGRERPRSHAPAELTVLGSIPDVMRFVVAVQELPPGRAFVPHRD